MADYVDAVVGILKLFITFNSVEKRLNFVSIGHCCHDKIDEQYILGGSASYASLVAQQLGCQSSILTSFGPDFLFKAQFESSDIALTVVPDTHTTLFENIYLPEGRTQYLHQKASDINKDRLEVSQYSADILLLCPIVDEVDIQIVDLFPNSLKGASIQGWLRTWGDDRKIFPKEMDWTSLGALDLVIVSEEDIGYSKDKLEKIVNAVSHVVLTDGMNEARVFIQDKELKFPAFPVNEVEATGAGDVFTTAYLYHYYQTKDVEKSCIFAHCAASFIVEGIGIRNLPTIEKILERVGVYG